MLQPISSSGVEASDHLVLNLVEMFVTSSSLHLIKLAKDQIEDYTLDHRRAVYLLVAVKAFFSRAFNVASFDGGGFSFKHIMAALKFPASGLLITTNAMLLLLFFILFLQHEPFGLKIN